MKRIAFFSHCLLFVGATALTRADSSYHVFFDEKPVGTARIDQRLLPGGEKQTELIMDLTREKRQVEVHNLTRYDSKGRQKREVQTLAPKGQSPALEVIADFTTGGAKLVVKKNGIPQSSTVALAGPVGAENEAEYWFIKTMPKLSDVSDSMIFNIDTMQWEESKTTYMGPGPGGYRIRIIRAHETVNATVDPKGSIISMDDSHGFRLLRDPVRQAR